MIFIALKPGIPQKPSYYIEKRTRIKGASVPTLDAEWTIDSYQDLYLE